MARGVRLPTTGWEIPGDLRVDPGKGRVCGREGGGKEGGTSIEYSGIQSTLWSCHCNSMKSPGPHLEVGKPTLGHSSISADGMISAPWAWLSYLLPPITVSKAPQNSENPQEQHEGIPPFHSANHGTRSLPAPETVLPLIVEPLISKESSLPYGRIHTNF